MKSSRHARRCLPRLAAQTLAGLGLAATWAGGLWTELPAQEPVSSRRSANVSLSRSAPPATIQVDELVDASVEPARLPPVAAESAFEPLPATGQELPVPPGGWVDRDEFGRPVGNVRPGIKLRLQECYWGYPEEFCERPFGMYNRASYDATIGNGLGDYLVMYDYDFYDGHAGPASQLNYAGLVRLQRIVKLLKGQTRQSIVVIENLPTDPRLSRERQQVVALQLAQAGVNQEAAKVMLGRPRRGLSGEQALLIHREFLRMASPLGAAAAGASSNNSSNSNTGGATSGLMAR